MKPIRITPVPVHLLATPFAQGAHRAAFFKSVICGGCDAWAGVFASHSI